GWAVWGGGVRAWGGGGGCIARWPGERVGSARVGGEGRPPLEHAHGFHELETVLEQRKPVGDPPRHRVQVAQRVRYVRRQLRDVPITGQGESALEQVNRVVEVAAGSLQTA